MSTSLQQEMSNPHSKSSLHRLYLACQRRAMELIRESATHGEHSLDRDTAQLLIAAIERFDFTLTPQLPGLQLARGRDFLEVFEEFHQGALRDARYRTALAAATAVHGDRAPQWLRTVHQDGEPVHDIAIGSDAGMNAVITHLAREHESRRKSTHLSIATGGEVLSDY
ncbi:hypothetical protein [Lysobacter changpingensis]|uniref:hypothetical protein n=1 Tax=Lysobacter changpingensis TaxID=2792784 RepID=UPI001A90979C|nr:hypothetical protein [Lysobacter changpingensis]